MVSDVSQLGPQGWLLGPQLWRNSGKGRGSGRGRVRERPGLSHRLVQPWGGGGCTQHLHGQGALPHPSSEPLGSPAHCHHSPPCRSANCLLPPLPSAPAGIVKAASASFLENLDPNPPSAGPKAARLRGSLWVGAFVRMREREPYSWGDRAAFPRCPPCHTLPGRSVPWRSVPWPETVTAVRLHCSARWLLLRVMTVWEGSLGKGQTPERKVSVFLGNRKRNVATN